MADRARARFRAAAVTKVMLAARCLVTYTAAAQVPPAHTQIPRSAGDDKPLADEEGLTASRNTKQFSTNKIVTVFSHECKI
jgi:hypothetical protein